MKVIAVISCASRGRSRGGWYESEHYQQLELNSRDYSNSITSLLKDFMILEVYEGD